MLGILILIMLIPLTMVGDLVHERSARRYEVESQIASQWGGSQIVGGPVLMIPYVTRSSYVREDGSTAETVTERSAFFLPGQAGHQAPIWIASCGGAACMRCWFIASEVELTGTFAPANFAEWNVPPAISSGTARCC